MQELARLDGEIIVWVQSALRASWLDTFFTTLTNGRLFVLPLLALALFLLWRGGPRGRSWVLAIVVVVALTDQLSSHVLKPLVSRARPCFAVPGVEALIHQVRSASFPSSHAANSFGVATLLWLGFPRWRWAALSLAVLISFSRIYVGVHFPSDALAGAALGVICGIAVWWGSSRVRWWARGLRAADPALARSARASHALRGAGDAPRH